MLVFSKGSCLSVVADRNEPGRFLVRAYLQGNIERVFPEAIVIARPDTPFRYRAFVDRAEISQKLGEVAGEIDYSAFHPVSQTGRREAFEAASKALRAAQAAEPFPVPKSCRVPVIRSDWKANAMGARRLVPLDLPIDTVAFEQIQLGLLPEVMEDKWFLYFEDPFLYCHRSWTGFESSRLELHRDAGSRRITGAYLSTDPSTVNWEDADEGVQVALDLVAVNLLGFYPWTNGDEKTAIKHWHLHGKAMLGQAPEVGIAYSRFLEK